MYGYIYTNSIYVDGAINEGIFKISKASFFRSLEAEGSLIPDSLDSAVQYDIGGLTDDELKIFADRIAHFKRYQITGAMDGAWHNEYKDYWIMSFSDSGDNDLLRSEGRDAILKVHNLTKLGDRLRRSHPDKLGRFEVSRVLYRARKMRPDQGFLIADEFYKDSSFSGQREIRIRWEVVSDVPESSFLTEAGKLSDLIESFV